MNDSIYTGKPIKPFREKNRALTVTHDIQLYNSKKDKKDPDDLQFNDNDAQKGAQLIKTMGIILSCFIFPLIFTIPLIISCNRFLRGKNNQGFLSIYAIIIGIMFILFFGIGLMGIIGGARVSKANNG